MLSKMGQTQKDTCCRLHFYAELKKQARKNTEWELWFQGLGWCGEIGDVQ